MAPSASENHILFSSNLYSIKVLMGFGGVALSGHPHKNVSERRYFCKLRSNLKRMFDGLGHFNALNGGFQTAKSNSRADALQMRQPLWQGNGDSVPM